MRRRLFTAGLAAAGCSAAMAQASYPNKPIRWIVGFAAGGASDAVVRRVAEVMSESLGQPIVVDNRPGASGQIAVGALLQAPADGYTIMAAENAVLVFNEFLFAKVAYNGERDFSYIAAIGQSPLALVVNPTFPARTVAEYIAHAKANRGKVTYASAGNTSLHRIGMEMFQRTAGIELSHVPYKGGLPAVQDVIGGQVDSMMFDLTNGLQNIRARQVRALAVAAPQRIVSIPDVPTFTELGFRQVLASTLHGVMGAAALPQAIVGRLNEEIKKAMRDPRVRQFFADTGIEAIPGSSTDFHKLVVAERARWGKLILAAGVKGD